MSTIELSGVSNPGWSFTDERIEQLFQFALWFSKKNEEDFFTYKEIQKEIEMSKYNIDGSKLRMFFPFLKDLGFISDYSVKFKKNELYTEVGTLFMNKIIPMYIYRTGQQDFVKEKIEYLFSLFLLNGLVRLYDNNSKPVYKVIIDILKTGEILNFNDFFVVTDCIANDIKDISVIKDKLANIRATGYEVKITKNQNSYGYIVPFLEQSRVVNKKDEHIVLNNDILKYMEVYHE